MALMAGRSLDLRLYIPALVLLGLLFIAAYQFSPAFADTYTYVRDIDGSLVAPSPETLNVPQGLAVDPNGNVIVADTGDNRVVIFNPGGTNATIISSFNSGDSFSSPQDVAVTSSGFYVTDNNNGRVVQFDSSGNFVRTFGSGNISYPVGIAVDSSGNVYVGDSGNGRIDKFDGTGNFLTSFTTSTGTKHFQPADVAVDPSTGNIYVSDPPNYRIVEFNSAGSYVLSFGSPGVGTGQFSNPQGVAVDPAGKILVTDLTNGRVEKFYGNGTFITVFGSFTASPSFSPGQFNAPADVALDSSGNVYVTDTNFNNISVYNFAPGGSPPPAPTNLVATLSPPQNVILTWNASAGATSYTIYSSPSAGGPFSTIAGTTSATTFTDNPPNTKTYYEVSATSPSGQSGFSNEATPVVPMPPVAPISVTATATSPTSITVSWAASVGANVYKVYRALSASALFNILAGTTTSTTLNDTAVSPATTYYYEVSANGPGGSSGLSIPPASATTPPLPPPTPVSVTATTTSSTSITVSWSASARAVSYAIFRASTASGPFTTQVGTSASPAFNDTGLVPATTYYYEITATNTGGTSPPSTPPVNATTFPLPPSTPTSVSANATSTTSITVTWAAAPGATSYVIYRSTSPSGPFNVEAGTSSATTFNNTGLAQSTTYYYEVAATNPGGSSALSSPPASATTLTAPPPPPAAPASVTATTKSSTSIAVSWTASVNATSYTVYRASTASGPFTTQVGTSASPAFNDTGLVPATTYYYEITASDAGGTSALSTPPASATTLPLPPASPASVTANATSANSITVTWTASANATSYTIYRSTSPSGPFNLRAGTSATTTFVDTGLASSTTYYYEIVATNSGGTSPLSSPPASAVTPVVQLESCSQTPSPENIRMIGSYVMFGIRGVHLEDSGKVNCGNVGEEPVNGEIHIEENSRLPNSGIVGTNVHIEENATVYQAFYFRTLHNEGTSMEAPNKTSSFYVSLPAFFPATHVSGAKDVSVHSSGTMALPAGPLTYGNVKVGARATLEFAGGNYTLDSLTIGNNASLVFDGPTTIHVGDAMEGGKGVSINSGTSNIDASKILFYVGQQVHIGRSSIIYANVYSLKEIHLDQGATAVGAFIASDIHVEKDSVVNLDYGFPLGSSNHIDYHVASTHGHGSVGKGKTFEFDVQSVRDRNGNLEGRLQYHDQSAKIDLQSTTILTLSANTDGSATFTGQAKVNGTGGFTFSVTVQDRADKSPLPDVFQIEVFNKSGTQTYSNPGPVTQGDVEVENSNLPPPHDGWHVGNPDERDHHQDRK